MPSSSAQTLKLKSTLRLLIPRLRMAQKKDTAVSIASRREMATLLESSREASARIRVENIIQTDICVELMEILELYAELLLARAGLLDARDKAVKEGTLVLGKSKGGGGGGVLDDGDGAGDDPTTGLEEAAASIIYAAPRLPREVRELGIVRAMLVERFGKEFALRAQENRDGVVPRRVVDKLRVEAPKEALVTAYLTEIARTYGVEWPRRREGEDEQMGELRDEVDGEDEDDDADEGGEGGGGKEPPIAAESGDQTQMPPSTPTPAKKKKTNTSRVDLGKAFDRAELSRATPPRDVGGPKSPVSVAPPGPRSDNLSPKVKLPDGKAAVAPPPPKGSKNVVGGAVPTVDDLAKRFSALKR